MFLSLAATLFQSARWLTVHENVRLIGIFDGSILQREKK